jgi:anaerobic selenocysteine-containing dehydrogenase
MTRHPSICRTCDVTCPVLVDVDDGRPVKVVGDPASPVYQGFSCIKGRAVPEQYVSPHRLLHSQKRQPDGSFTAIPVEAAMDEIAARLQTILDEHGPLAIASYIGTSSLANQCSWPMQAAFMKALGDGRMFNAVTIDQPGKSLALGFMGVWAGGSINAIDADVALVFGANPLISGAGGRSKVNTIKSFHDARRHGRRLIVIDPCRTETAKLADVHLQPRPGEDIAIAAGMIRLIVDEGHYDHAFVEAETQGLVDLRHAVDGYTPDEVARRAGIDAEAFVTATRMFASAGTGVAVAGTGPNMASGAGTVFEYLVAALNVLHGSYLRAGDPVWDQKTLGPQKTRLAQAIPPFPACGFGAPFRAKPLADTICGPPTAAVADEMLLPGEGRIRAFVSMGGNPLVAWPDQLKVRDAFAGLDLLVQIDPWMSATAKAAHYVIAPTLQFEVPGISNTFDLISGAYPGIAMPGPWGQYTPALVEPPAGSDVIPEWAFFHGVAARMGLQLEFGPTDFGSGQGSTRPLDMTQRPDADDLLAILCEGSRIPLDEVKAHPHGISRLDPEITVAPKSEGWDGLLDLGSDVMLGELARDHERGHGDVLPWATDDFPLRLVSRRIVSRYNSSGHFLPKLQAADAVNPLRIHPDDADARGLHDGDHVEVTSARGSVPALVQLDETMRNGVVAMTHGWGGLPEADDQFTTIGSAVARLSDCDAAYDRFSGQPVMTNIPVQVAARVPR